MSPAEIKDPSGRVVLTLPLPFAELPRDGSPVEVKIHGDDGEPLPLVILIKDDGRRLTVQAVDSPVLQEPAVRRAFMALGEHIAQGEISPRGDFSPRLGGDFSPRSPGFAEPSPFETATVALMAVAGNYPDPIDRTLPIRRPSKGGQRRREKPWNRRSPWR